MIDILLASYNGEKYIAQQLESLLQQTYTNFTVHINDDLSSDRTWEIVSSYAEKYPGKIVATRKHNGGASQNFFWMLQNSDAQYVMFCDQDDVWAPEKVQLSITAMEKEEENVGAKPLLLHTDLEVTDANLVPIAKSFMHYQDLNPFATKLPKLIVQNNVTGCTVLFNKPLRDLIRIPSQPVMYDWWIALCASALGTILYLNDATVLYRQHADNAVGAQDAHTLSYNVAKLRNSRAVTKSLQQTYSMANLLLSTYEDRLDSQQKEFLSSYMHMDQRNFWSRWHMLAKYGAFKKGLRRKVGQIFWG